MHGTMKIKNEMANISIPYCVNVNKDSSLQHSDSLIITDIPEHHSASNSG